MSGTRDWDASTYDRVSAPQVEWAAGVVERLDLRGDEIVLDAGCGSGRVTELLLAELGKGGSAIAVDGSAAMAGAARERLAGTPTRVLHSDLLELELREEVDAVFSNAVFHWIHDHARLFTVLHAAIRPGGRIEAQCGGEGNVAGFYAVLRAIAAQEPYTGLRGYEPNHFAGAAETEWLLRRAGFTDVRCWLVDWPVRPPEPREFVRSVCLGAHSERLAEDLREPFLDEVLDRLGPDPELGYVRLNISARKGDDAGVEPASRHGDAIQISSRRRRRPARR